MWGGGRAEGGSPRPAPEVQPPLAQCRAGGGQRWVPHVQHPRCSLHQPRLCNIRVADSSVLGTPESEPGAGWIALMHKARLAGSWGGGGGEDETCRD